MYYNFYPPSLISVNICLSPDFSLQFPTPPKMLVYKTKEPEAMPPVPLREIYYT